MKLSLWIRNLLGKIAKISLQSPSLFLSLGVLGAIGSIYLIQTRLVVVNNTNALIREDSPFHQNFLNYKKEFAYEEDYVVTIRSEDVALNRKIADQIGDRVRSVAGIDRVWARMNFDSLKNRFLFYLSEEELKGIELDIQGYVQAMKSGGFKLDLNSMLTKANQSFQEEYLRKEENWKEFKPFIDRFIEMLNQLGDQLEGKVQEKKSALTQKGDRSGLKLEDLEKQLEENAYISLNEGKLVMVLATPTKVDPKAAAPYTKTVAELRKALAEIQPKYPSVKIALTGEPVIMDDELRTSTEDSIKSGIVSFILVALLMVVSYRQRTRPLFVLLTLLIGTLASLGFAVLGIGHLNMISQAFVAMVIGLGVDFGIQMMGRYEEELAQGKFVGDALDSTLRNTGYAVTTGAFTTAIAFFTMCYNDFIGLAEFGIVAGSGILICLIGALAFLPSIFSMQDRRKSPAILKEGALKSAWVHGEAWNRRLLGNPRSTIVLTVLVTLILIIFIPRVTFDHNLLNLQNQSLESVQEVRKLTDSNEKSVIYGVVIAENLQDCRAKSEKLAALSTVREVQSPAIMIPDHQTQKLPIIQSIVHQLQSVKLETDVKKQVDVNRARRELREFLMKCREGERQAKMFTGISSQAREAVDLFRKLIPPLERSLHLLEKTSQNEIGKRLNQYQIEVFGSMLKGLLWLKNHATDRGIEFQDFPVEIQKRYLAGSGRMAIEVYPKENVWNREANVHFVNDLRSIDAKATGTPIQNYEYIEVLRRSYLEAALWAFVAIVVLISIHFRKIKFILMALAPLFLAVLWTLGVMGLFQVSFNPANIVTLPLTIGIGVAYGIYVVDRFQECGKMDLFSNSTGKSILLSGLTTMIGFGALMLSHYQGMFSIGFLMSVSVFFCLMTSLLVLPSFIILFFIKSQSVSP